MIEPDLLIANNQFRLSVQLAEGQLIPRTIIDTDLEDAAPAFFEGAHQHWKHFRFFEQSKPFAERLSKPHFNRN
ncbi:hypothetical protein [Mesorhizobium sp. M0643]|uniref:hypothetical protein n=1 Tax=Mesorhizobium sp. M0643 TaxID=2956978 RepID=UPI0003CEBEF7|nr:hypothetical protein X772_09270 [Mesorhizobium sp. LSJC280B00]